MNIPDILRSFLEIRPIAGTQQIPVHVIDETGRLRPVVSLERVDSLDDGPLIVLCYGNRGKPMPLTSIWKALLALRSSEISAVVGEVGAGGEIEFYRICGLSVLTTPKGIECLVLAPLTEEWNE